MSQDITMTDFFCGAGGSSKGGKDAGVIIKTAVNSGGGGALNAIRNKQSSRGGCRLPVVKVGIFWGRFGGAIVSVGRVGLDIFAVRFPVAR